jgi:hypothetical protein
MPNNPDYVAIKAIATFLIKNVAPITDNNISDNIVLGKGALSAIKQKNWSAAEVADNQVPGTGNVAFGHNALSATTTGNNNIAEGTSALMSNVSGHDNIALGYYTLKSNIGGSFNIAQGNSSLISNTGGNNNIALGHASLASNKTGNSNIALGNSSLLVNTIGDGNIALGDSSLKANTEGTFNIGIGLSSLQLNTTGEHNIALGFMSLDKNISGSRNIAQGYQSLYNNTTGNNNVAQGYRSLYLNTTGTNNTAVGNSALSVPNIYIGNKNTALGYNALCGYTGMTGPFTNSTAIGANAIITSSNQVQLGDYYTTTYTYGAVHNIADARDIKTTTVPRPMGLDFINSLEPVAYYTNYRKDYSSGGTGEILGNKFHYGLIADDVKGVTGAANFAGYQNLKDINGADVQTIGYTEFIGPMIKAIQELLARVKVLENA